MASSNSSGSVLSTSKNRRDWAFLGVLGGAALGASLYNARCSDLLIEIIGFPGEMYLRALQQLSLPLVTFSLMTGVFRTKQSAGRIFRWSLGYYLISMLLAVTLGITLVYFVKPGAGATFPHAALKNCSQKENSTALPVVSTSKNDASTIDPFLNIGRDLIPENFVKAAAQSNYLALVACATLSAYAINTFGDRANCLIELVYLLNDIILKIILAVLAVTPIGVCSLTANAILKACDISRVVSSLGVYTMTIAAGLFIHTFVLLPMTVVVLSQRNPFKQLRSFCPALVMALGTSSAAATMPQTLVCAETSGCDSGIVSFVIPFGANFNRDGSALYEAMSVLFICQVRGLHFSFGSLLALALAASLTTIGCSSVPNSGLVTMTTILQVVGFPEYVGDVAVLYAADWILGSIRASVNVWGDACACNIVDEWAKRYKLRRGSSLKPDDLQVPLLPC